MYGIIFDWFATLFVGTGVTQLSGMSFTIGGASVNATDWLCHLGTIIVLAFLVFVCFKFLCWLVRLVSHSFLLRR